LTENDSAKTPTEPWGVSHVKFVTLIEKEAGFVNTLPPDVVSVALTVKTLSVLTVTYEDTPLITPVFVLSVRPAGKGVFDCRTYVITPPSVGDAESVNVNG
jgi:hypothetical protein